MNKLQIFVLMFVLGYLQSFSQNNATVSQEVTDTPIPEVLLSFDAILNGEKVELTWASNAEYNNNFFTIERSKDAIAFETFLKIRNFGNNSNLISYFDIDNTPYEGISYYRLTQTNAAGHTMSSRMVLVNNKGENKILKLADNSTQMLDLDRVVEEEIVVLRDERGEERFSKVMVDQNNEVTIASDNPTKLTNGTYVIIASSDDKLYSKIVRIQ